MIMILRGFYVIAVIIVVLMAMETTHDQIKLADITDLPPQVSETREVNKFFFDGYWWLIENDRWYRSKLYSGPWSIMLDNDVPEYPVFNRPIQRKGHQMRV